MDGEPAGPAAAARGHAQRRAFAGRWGSPSRGAKARAAGDGQPAASARDRAVRPALPGRGERGALTLRSGGSGGGAPRQLTLSGVARPLRSRPDINSSSRSWRKGGHDARDLLAAALRAVDLSCLVLGHRLRFFEARPALLAVISVCRHWISPFRREPVHVGPTDVAPICHPLFWFGRSIHGSVLWPEQRSGAAPCLPRSLPARFGLG